MTNTQTPDRSPIPFRKHVPSSESVAAWMDLMETCEQLMQAGLRFRIGPNGDLAAAWRLRTARRMAQRDREIAHMLDPLRRPGTGNAV